jgi:putative serine protease PepD
VPSDTRGAGIVSLLASGPAADAGIHEGDVIVSLNGRAVRSAPDLNTVLLDVKPGDRVSVDLVSKSGSRTVQVTLGTRPAGI